MLSSPSTKRLICLQIVTLGLYFFRWCSVSRSELNKVLGRSKIPTTWFMALPAANYWWMWQYAEAVEAVTRGRLKRSDTFLYYIIASCGGYFLGGFNFSGGNSSSDQHLSAHALKLIVIGIFVAVYVLAMVGNTFFICIAQRRIDRVRGVRHA